MNMVSHLIRICWLIDYRLANLLDSNVPEEYVKSCETSQILQDTSELVFFKVTYPTIFYFNFCMNIS